MRMLAARLSAAPIRRMFPVPCFAGLVLVGLLAACSPAPTAPAPTTTAPAPAPTAPAPTVAAATAPTASGATKLAPLSPPVTINVSDQQFALLAPVYVALDRGYFHDLGLDVQMVPMNDPPTMVTLLGTGELGFSEIGPDPGLFNTMQSGIDVRLVASAANNRAQDRVATFMVRQDLIDSGRYKSPSDLKGMNIAANAQQSQFFVARVLAMGGLTINDANIVTLGLPDMVPAFQNKAIDAAWEVEPLVTSLESRGVAKTQFTTGGLFPNNVGQALVMSPVLARNQPEAAQRFVLAYMRGLRDYYHAFNKNDGDRPPVVQALVAHTAVKDPNLFNVIGMQSVDPNAKLDLGTWDSFQDYYIANGVQKVKLDLTHYIDTGILNAALDQLGRE